jgi:hypothetical protein
MLRIDDGCDAWFHVEAPEEPPPLRMYAQKPREALAQFEVPAGWTISEAIAQACSRAAGGGAFTRAMVVVK